MRLRRALLILAAAAAPACTTAPAADTNRELTVGLVQKEIRMGMSQAEVAQVLGSPNIVTRDAEGKETWIYDKIGTEASYSTSSSGGSILVLYGSRTQATSRVTQKTLTVIVKFNQEGKVDYFTYHASKF